MAQSFPLLHKQERRLIADELVRRVTGTSKNIAQFAMAFAAEEPIDRGALTRALNAAVARHAALRTVFVPSSRYDDAFRTTQLQTFFRTGLYVPGLYEQHPLEQATVDVSERAWSGDGQELEALAAEECGRFLDPATAPALRALLVAGVRQQLVIVNLSHLVLDLWAIALLHREVAHAYAAFVAGVPWEQAPVLQQHDLVAEETARVQSPEGERDLAYWTAHYGALGDALITASELPFGTGVPARLTADVVRVPLSEDDARQVHQACRGRPDYAFWRTMYGIALGMLVNKTRVAFTANFLNRRRPGAQNVLAWCAHPHMLAVDAPWSSPWADVWRHVRSGVRQAQVHERCSCDSVAQRLGRPIVTNTSLAFDVVPGHSPYADAPLQPVDVPGVVPLSDLTVRVHHVSHAYALVATFNNSRYDAGGVSRLLTLLLETIRVCAARPSATVGDVVRAVRQRHLAPVAIGAE